jgi:hypothetical protein
MRTSPCDEAILFWNDDYSYIALLFSLETGLVAASHSFSLPMEQWSNS